MAAFANAYQSFVYLGGFLLALALLLKKNSKIPVSVQVAYIYMLGGFIFFAFWENKPRYMLPFFVCLVLIVPHCMDEIVKFLAYMGIRFKKIPSENV